MADANLTKREFARVIKGLMTDAAFDKISVGDICHASHLSRKTFYYHFQDKYELVNWVFFTEFVLAMREKEGIDEWTLIRNLCDYLYANRLFYVHAFEIQGQDCFRDYFTSFFLPQLTEIMHDAFSNSYYRELYVIFFVDAVAMAIARWLRENRMPAEEFVLFLKECIQGAATVAIRRAEKDGQLTDRLPQASPPDTPA